VRDQLKYIGDIDMFLSRLSLGRVGPKDVVQFKKSLIAVREIFKLLEASNDENIQKIIKKL
jgi:DNA mismatch repair protein MutS